MTEDRRYRVGFSLVKGVGAVRLRGLLDYFGDAQAAWNASAFDLVGAGLSTRLAARVVETRKSLDLDDFMARTEKSGIRVMTTDDGDYPARLKEIDQPPPVLYVRGEITPEDHWALGIVGTRGLTTYGRQVTEELASALAANAITVVSGLARGVDGAAHNAALKAGGRTLAVLGSGVDNVYPPEHRQLAEKIIANGALISDYPPGTPPESANFPPRNRIISGLSQAVVVVEAGEVSGSLITAGFALGQGRDVYAVPGPLFSPKSKGTNALIAKGARVYLDSHSLLEELSLVRNLERQGVRRSLPPDTIEADLMEVIGQMPTHVDDISARLGKPVQLVLATLTLMELKGLVRQVGGTNFVAVGEDAGDYSTGG